MVTAKARAPSGEGLYPLLAHFEASEWALLKVKTFHTHVCVSVCLQRKEGESGGCQVCFFVAVRKAWETELYVPQILSRSPQ